MSVFIRRWSGGAAKLLLTGMAVAGLSLTVAPSANAAMDAFATGNSPGAASENLVAVCHQNKYSNATINSTGTYTAADGSTYFYAKGRCY